MSYTLEKWIKPSNSICLNVTFLHFILCLIYYILSGGGKKQSEDRSQDVAWSCNAWIKLGSKAHEPCAWLQIPVQLMLTWALPFQVVVSMGVVQGSLPQETGLHAWSTWRAAWEEGRKGKRASGGLTALSKDSKTSKCFPSEVTGHLLEGKKQSLSSGLSQDQKTLIPKLKILSYKREGWGSTLCHLSFYYEPPSFISCHLSLCTGGQHRTPGQWKIKPEE